MDKRQAGVRRYLSDTSMACSTPSAILTPSPSSTPATDTEDQPRNPTTPRGLVVRSRALPSTPASKAPSTRRREPGVESALVSLSNRRGSMSEPHQSHAQRQ